MTMNDDLIELVKKHLPAMQVDALRGELEKAKDVERLKKQIDTKDAAHQQDLQKIGALEGEIRRLKKFEDKAAEVEKRERDVELQLLKKDVECAQVTLSRVEGLAMAAFRNPTIYKSFSNEVLETNNGYSQSRTLHSSSTERAE